MLNVTVDSSQLLQAPAVLTDSTLKEPPVATALVKKTSVAFCTCEPAVPAGKFDRSNLTNVVCVGEIWRFGSLPLLTFALFDWMNVSASVMPTTADASRAPSSERDAVVSTSVNVANAR